MRLAKILAGVAAGALLVVGGVMSVNAARAVDSQTSTFTKSTFDYIVTSPSNDQISSFEANKEAVSVVFPTYNFKQTLRGTSPASVNLLASDKMENYDISFFNPRRVVSGSYDESGLLLDEEAAGRLGAKVGSEVKFDLGNGSYTLTVKAIYARVSYQTMASGVAMVKFTNEMKAGFAKPFASYELAFIAANDKAKCAELLKDYKPYGELMTYEDYKVELKKTADPAMTDDEFEAAAQDGYAKYKNNWENAKHLNCVQEKSKYMAGAEDAVATTKERSFSLSVLFAIFTPLLLGGVLVGFDFAGIKRDEEEKVSGATKGELRKKIFTFDAIAVGAAVVIGLAGTLIYSLVTGGIDVASLLIYSLPAVVALAISIPLGIVYSNKVYGKSNVSKGGESIKEID